MRLSAIAAALALSLSPSLLCGSTPVVQARRVSSTTPQMPIAPWVYDPLMQRLDRLDSSATRLSKDEDSSDATAADGDDDDSAASSNVDPFDLYILALSWQPAFCHECPVHGGCPGCTQPHDYWRTHFTLHGLWPEMEDGSYPEECTEERFNASTVEKGIGIDVLEQFWPNVKAQDDTRKYPSFWAHEWQTHGTCTGLEQLTFFNLTVGLLRDGHMVTPSLIQDNVGSLVPTHDVRKAFGGAVVLKCDNKDEPGDLAQVFVCWGKDEYNHPTTQRACPPSVLKENSCVDENVRILAFP